MGRVSTAEQALLKAPGKLGPSRGSRFAVFDILRIAAALGVILTHSFALLGRPEPALTIGGFPFTLGWVCVGVFFTISGYLVSASWDREPRLMPFVRKRFARVWPGLFVCVAVTAFVLGPLVSTEPAGKYLGDSRTWTYVGKTAGALYVSYELPGVFNFNPYPDAVNGSLWTLPVEVLAYGGVLVAGLLNGFRHKWVLAATAVAVFAAFHVVAVSHLADNVVVYGVGLYQALMLGSWFVSGALIFAFNWVPGNRAGATSALAVAAAIATGIPTLFIVASAVLCVWLGSRSFRWAASIRRAGDPSYGTYLYAFPVQQTLIFLGVVRGSPWSLFAVAAVVSLLCGYLSWHLLERPSLRRLRP